MPADRPAQERGEGIRRWTLCEEIRDGAMTWRVDGPPPDGRNVTVADEQAVCREALREAAEKLREIADGKDDAPIAELRGWKRAARVLDRLASEPAEGSEG